MNNPTVVNPTEFGIKEEEAKQLTSGLEVALTEREVLKDAYLDVIDLEITEENLSTFKELRLKLVTNRTQGFDKWRKTQKAYFLAGGNFVQAIYNKEIAVNQEMESKLMAAEKHFENLEKERLEKLNQERKSLLSPFVEDVENMSLSDMADDVWEAYFSTKKKNFEDKKAEEEKAEAERIEAARIEAERIKAQEIENAKLKAEAEKREKEIAKEKAAQAKKDAEEIKKLAKLKDDRRISAISFLLENGFKAAHGGHEAIDYPHFIGALHYSDFDKDSELETFKTSVLEQKEIAKQRINAEELKAKADKLAAELKAKEEAEKLAAKKEKEEADKLAKAPIKKQLQKWIEDCKIESAPVDNDTTKEIQEKFNSFKKWAASQIEKI